MPYSVVRPDNRVPALGPFDRARHRAREARLEVQDPDPVRMDEDARHAWVERRRLLEQGLSVFLAHRPPDHRSVLRRDAFDCVDPHRSPNEEDLGGPSVGVDGEGHPGARLQRLRFGRIRRRRQDDLRAIPVEADRDDAGRTVAPRVGEMRRALRLQQLPGDRILEQAEVSFLGRHAYSPFPIVLESVIRCFPRRGPASHTGE